MCFKFLQNSNNKIWIKFVDIGQKVEKQNLSHKKKWNTMATKVMGFVNRWKTQKSKEKCERRFGKEKES